jgi:DNA-binding MarR family transcriptional regulator
MPNENTIKQIMEFASHLDDIDLNVLGDGLEIARLHRQLEQVVENDLIAGWGLTARQVEIMESLYHNAEGTATPADLSEEVGLTRSAMTSVLDSLEKLGYTVRGPHPSDRRMVVITLTPTGRDFISLRLPERYQKLHRIIGTLSDQERTNLLHAYRKVLDALIGELKEIHK